ncbi:mitochondrial F1-F0 ATP synthase subunit F of fungi-domain-containing protein [Naematelia encephala]|uniref:Mitochondrial F1-F0 ATP synthase subunit F of fungi-domain-containing protein n=1 Tax=Naematelia encephala TaxID=71784 RepID=A0A1Y2AE03_9TREE|nr:mitochondrial F1-F0 ATP synthase subunit F of fungi-domain-containing protein [Naematelia encephala]
MFSSAARRSLANLIPPKIATPSAVSSGSTSQRTANVIEFYSKLPKGSLPDSQRAGGIRGRYFEGKNASGFPIVATVLSLIVVGYTLDYHMHLKHHKNGHH